MTDVDTGNGHVLSLPVRVSLREAMAQFATGVTIVTVGGQRCHGMTANAFTSVSLDPPLVLVCVAKAARLHAAILADGCFAVSVLGGDQAHVARYFADRGRPAGMAQFDAVQWRPGACTGAPLLSGALAWLECDVVGTARPTPAALPAPAVVIARCSTVVRAEASVGCDSGHDLGHTTANWRTGRCKVIGMNTRPASVS